MTRVINLLRISIPTTLLALGLLFAAAPPAQAALFDDAKKDACAGANLQNNSSGNCGATATTTLTTRLQDFISLFSIIIGVIAVIMIMVAGFRYITSGGDANGITSAKNTLIYAIVGLIIAALAQVIVRFVLRSV